MNRKQSMKAVPPMEPVRRLASTPAPKPLDAAGVAPARKAEMSPENLKVLVEPEVDGVAELTVRYHGPLAENDKLFVRFGERRDGHDWREPRDVAMYHLGQEAWATIACREGTTLQGGCFAFHAPKPGAPEETWDNAGHPLGYYAFDARTGKVEAR